jgi:anti-sigma regulatory factor (Ser/Thr protein kinase)
MAESRAETVELQLPLHVDMLPVVVGCTEQTAQAFGFGKDQQLSLALAVEEVFAFLTAQGKEQETLRLTYRHGGYYMVAVCVFLRRALPVKVFNMTARPALEDENFLAEMGLLLASRTVDHFKITMEKDGGMGIYLTLEKRYPQVFPETVTALPRSGFYLCEPEREEIKEFARQVTNYYNADAPSCCHFPGKLVDMVSSAEYDAVLAQDDKGNVGGGFFWLYNGKMAECFGPYVFTAQEGLAAALVEGAIEKLARTGVLGMAIRQPTGQVPAGYFEPLGELSFIAPDGTRRDHTALYRQMEEDNGMTVFTHPQIETFMRERYNLLVLPRQLRTTVYEGEGRSADSAISTRLDRHQATATLSFLVAGDDAQANLVMHVTVLHREGIKNIFFELDLGRAEEVQLVPAILAAGFTPQLILPWSGCGDVAVFIHAGEE